jgi:hypothetical protein
MRARRFAIAARRESEDGRPEAIPSSIQARLKTIAGRGGNMR